MPTYIGMVSFRDGGKSGGDALAVGRAARALIETHGGRILSIYWTEDTPDMVIAFEGRDRAQAAAVYDDLASQQGVDIRMARALTEGEKERQLSGQDV